MDATSGGQMWIRLTTVSGKPIAINFDHALKMTPRSGSSDGTLIEIEGKTETVQESMSDILGRIETQLGSRRH